MMKDQKPISIQPYLPLINGLKCIITKQTRGMISKRILQRSPNCNLLVFGLGRDSELWHRVNERGYTLFVEHDPRWAKVTAAQIPGINICVHHYLTQCDPKLEIHQQPAIDTKALEKFEMPEQIRQRDWDMILVDGPTGFDSHCPGRMLSIYWTSLISDASCDIFIDDYMRPIEFTYTNKFLFHRYNKFQILNERHKMLWLQPG